MAKTALIAKITAADGRRDDLVAELQKMFPQVESEDGTELYILHEDVGDANVVWFYELYTDHEALGAHSTSEAMLELMNALSGDLSGAPAELTLVTPIGAKGVDV
jgi:quinol monooxygenase YgiN